MTQASSPADQDEATPSVSGTFALFDTPNGGVHVVVRFAGEETERHKDIPPAMAAFARQVFEEGSLAGAVRALASRKTRTRVITPPQGR